MNLAKREKKKIERKHTMRVDKKNDRPHEQPYSLTSCESPGVVREEEDPDAVLLILDPPKGKPDFPPTVAEEELPPL